MSTMTAWKVEVAPGQFAILPRQSLGHLLDTFRIERVPLAPDYAKHVFAWKGQVVPVLNLTACIQNNARDIEHKDEETDLTEQTTDQVKTLMGIVTYRQGDALLHGGIIMYSSPVVVEVPNEPCDFPRSKIPWKQFATSCVQLERKKHPILSLDLTFSPEGQKKPA
jgi:chemotaxis signal transduction protein